MGGKRVNLTNVERVVVVVVVIFSFLFSFLRPEHKMEH